MRRFFLALFAASVVSLFSTGFAGTSFSQSPDSKAIADPNRHPNIIDARFVLGWASVTLNDLFMFSYKDYEQKLDDRKDFFTSTGLSSFYKTLTGSGVIKTIQERKLSMKGYIVSPITLSERKMKNGTYYWTASFEYALEYISEDPSASKKSLYSLMSVSIDIYERQSPNGVYLGIGQWLSSAAEAPPFCPCAEPKEAGTGDLREILKKKIDIDEETLEEEYAE